MSLKLSPIVDGVTPYNPTFAPLADRLVILVTDGMRAESFIEHKEAIFLRDVASSRGLWGISHSRVPTESRPGHVAIIAGFYEDPSAVTKGWKKNPVDFDSVFNRSSSTWCWGAEDILHIFLKQNESSHIHAQSYSMDSQQFNSVEDTSELDKWVFDRVEEHLQSALANVTLQTMMKQDRVILFLHLLGLDTSGHTHKPNSACFQYLPNATIELGVQCDLVNYLFYSHMASAHAAMEDCIVWYAKTNPDGGFFDF